MISPSRPYPTVCYTLGAGYSGHKFPTRKTEPLGVISVNIDGCEVIGRGERIRTSDLSVPNRAHYQAVLRPELSLL